MTYGPTVGLAKTLCRLARGHVAVSEHPVRRKINKYMQFLRYFRQGQLGLLLAVALLVSACGAESATPTQVVAPTPTTASAPTPPPAATSAADAAPTTG